MAGVPSLLVCILTGWFTFLVFRQFLRNHRQNLGFWALSLFLAAVGSLGYCLAAWHVAGSVAWFLVYYICGALWMAAFMGLGSLALAWNNKAVWFAAVAVGVIGVVGTIDLVVSPVNHQTLAALDGGAGTGVITNEALWVVCLAVLNTFGAAAVILVAAWSAVRTLKRRSPVRFWHGNLWLAVGVLIISLAGTSARLGWPGLFWVTMLVGWILTFVGYRLLTPRHG